MHIKGKNMGNTVVCAGNQAVWVAVCVVGKGAVTDKAHLNPKAGSRFGRCIILKGL